MTAWNVTYCMQWVEDSACQWPNRHARLHGMHVLMVADDWMAERGSATKNRRRIAHLRLDFMVMFVTPLLRGMASRKNLHCGGGRTRVHIFYASHTRKNHSVGHTKALHVQGAQEIEAPTCSFVAISSKVKSHVHAGGSSHRTTTRVIAWSLTKSQCPGHTRGGTVV